jgi:hypothetical protein
MTTDTISSGTSCTGAPMLLEMLINCEVDFVRKSFLRTGSVFLLIISMGIIICIVQH